MKIFIIPAMLLVLISCDYREYPQEEEWKEEFEDRLEEQERRN